jgi:hypothetical protein
VSSRETTKVLGIDRRNIKHGIERRLLLETTRHVFWIDYKRPKRLEILSDPDVQTMVDWWII